MDLRAYLRNAAASYNGFVDELVAGGVMLADSGHSLIVNTSSQVRQ